MKAQVFGKYGNNALNAVTIILQERRISGTITDLVEQNGGQLATIDEFGIGPVQVFIPPETSVFLVGGRPLSVNDLCTGQEVRVVLEPAILDPLTAKVIFIRPEKRMGEVVSIDRDQRSLLVDEDGDPWTMDDRQIITVPLGAKILKSEEDDGEQKEFLSFNDIEVKDIIVYFGLPVCQDTSKFNAFVIIVVEEYDDDEGGDDDFDNVDYLPKFILDNDVYIRLCAGLFDQSLTVRGNNFRLFGQVGATKCGVGDWTFIGGDVEIYGNNARFTNITFLGTVRVIGNGVEFINCCFQDGDPIYPN
jgi:hypothetical protein